jgi:hypothetical protein
MWVENSTVSIGNVLKSIIIAEKVLFVILDFFEVGSCINAENFIVTHIPQFAFAFFVIFPVERINRRAA